jgi:hypothetical protein
VRFTDTHPQLEKFLRKLVGRMDIEDATTKLDHLTQEEALMAHARSLELLLGVETKVDTVIDGTQHVSRYSPLLSSTFILLGESQARRS